MDESCEANRAGKPKEILWTATLIGNPGMADHNQQQTYVCMRPPSGGAANSEAVGHHFKGHVTDGHYLQKLALSGSYTQLRKALDELTAWHTPVATIQSLQVKDERGYNTLGILSCAGRTEEIGKVLDILYHIQGDGFDAVRRDLLNSRSLELDSSQYGVDDLIPHAFVRNGQHKDGYYLYSGMSAVECAAANRHTGTVRALLQGGAAAGRALQQLDAIGVPDLFEEVCSLEPSRASQLLGDVSAFPTAQQGFDGPMPKTAKLSSSVEDYIDLAAVVVLSGMLLLPMGMASAEMWRRLSRRLSTTGSNKKIRSKFSSVQNLTKGVQISQPAPTTPVFSSSKRVVAKRDGKRKPKQSLTSTGDRTCAAPNSLSSAVPSRTRKRSKPGRSPRGLTNVADLAPAGEAGCCTASIAGRTEEILEYLVVAHGSTEPSAFDCQVEVADEVMCLPPDVYNQLVLGPSSSSSSFTASTSTTPLSSPLSQCTLSLGLLDGGQPSRGSSDLSQLEGSSSSDLPSPASFMGDSSEVPRVKANDEVLLSAQPLPHDLAVAELIPNKCDEPLLSWPATQATPGTYAVSQQLQPKNMPAFDARNAGLFVPTNGAGGSLLPALPDDPFAVQSLFPNRSPTTNLGGVELRPLPELPENPFYLWPLPATSFQDPQDPCTGSLHGAFNSCYNVSSQGLQEDMLICPITQEMFTDPVFAADGYTYERKAISTWLLQHNASPMTNLPLPHKHLTPAHLIRAAVQGLREKGRDLGAVTNL